VTEIERVREMDRYAWDGQSPREFVQGSCGARGGGSLERIMHQFKLNRFFYKDPQCSKWAGSRHAVHALQYLNHFSQVAGTLTAPGM